MIKLNFEFALLYSENLRSLYYLDYLKKNKFAPSIIFEIPNNKITKKINLKHQKEINRKKYLLNYFIKRSLFIKVKDTKKYLLKNILKSNIKYFIFAGNYGQILGPEFFKFKKKYIHVHPGNLPFFRGSTTYYYEYLLKNKVTYSSIFLSEKLDSGQIIKKKIFNPMGIDFSKLDDVYDPNFRSQVLIETLKKLKKKISFNKCKNKIYPDYKVIHPLLKHLAILKSKFS